MRVPTSLAYHLADIYIEELDKALATVESPAPAPVSTILEPFLILAAQTSSSTTCKRMQSSVFQPLLDALSSPPDRERPAKRQKLEDPCYPNLKTDLSVEELKKQILKQIFDVASRPETKDSNRRRMYTLWKEEQEE